MIAKKSDWKTSPFPQQHSVIDIDQSYSDQDIDLIRQGLIPEEMEDKWFLYWEGNKLYFHRSWTGHCIYILGFKKNHAGYNSTQLLVNRNIEQYKQLDDVFDKKMALFLINTMLLNNPSTYPDSGSSFLNVWSQIGSKALD